MRRHLSRPLTAAAFVVVFLGAAWFTGCDLSMLWSRKSHLLDIVSEMIPPEWSFAGKVLPLLWTTVQMSVTGTVLGAVLAIPAAMGCATTLPGPWGLKKALRFCIQLLRSFPALILALLATFFLGIGAFAGTAAITVYTFAIMTRLTYEDMESVPLGPCIQLCKPWEPVRFGPLSIPFFRKSHPPISPMCSICWRAMYATAPFWATSGAGGIGLLLNEKVSWREYGKVGMILILLFLVVYGMEALSAGLTRLVQHELTMGRTGQRLLAGVAAGLFAFCTLTLPVPDLSRTSLRMVQVLLDGLLHPDLELLFRFDRSGLAYLLLETAAMALVGTCVGVVLAVPLSFLGSGRFFPAPVAWFFRTVVAAIRSIPSLIYGLIFIRVCGPSSFTGVLTMAVCSVGLLCKRFSEAIDALDLRPVHVLEAMGVSRLVRICHGVLPQLTPQIASGTLYRFDVNIREASVLGLAGAGGIGVPLIFAMNQYAWNEVSTLALGMIFLAWLVDMVSSACRKTF